MFVKINQKLKVESIEKLVNILDNLKSFMIDKFIYFCKIFILQNEQQKNNKCLVHFYYNEFDIHDNSGTHSTCLLIDQSVPLLVDTEDFQLQIRK